MEKPLIDWTDEELKVGIRTEAKRVGMLGYNDCLRELERRGTERQARWSRALSVAGRLIAVAAIVVTALKS